MHVNKRHSPATAWESSLPPAFSPTHVVLKPIEIFAGGSIAGLQQVVGQRGCRWKIGTDSKIWGLKYANDNVHSREYICPLQPARSRRGSCSCCMGSKIFITITINLRPSRGIPMFAGGGISAYCRLQEEDRRAAAAGESIRRSEDQEQLDQHPWIWTNMDLEQHGLRAAWIWAGTIFTDPKLFICRCMFKSRTLLLLVLTASCSLGEYWSE